MIILDGEAGIVIVNPNEEEIKEYQAKREEFIAYKEELKKMKNEKSVTLDDHHVELVANIGSPKDIQGVQTMAVKELGYSELNSYIWNLLNYQVKINNTKFIKKS